MKRLRRMLRTTATTLSMLLFLAVIVAWVRGYLSYDRCIAFRESLDEKRWRVHGWKVEWGGGGIALGYHHVEAPNYAADTPDVPSVQWLRIFTTGQPLNAVTLHCYDLESLRWKTDELRSFKQGGVVMWFAARREAVNNPKGRMFWNARISEYRIALPCWLAALLFGVLPGWRAFAWAQRRRRLRRVRSGRCIQCGYDLRATPDRCPECGTIPPPPPAGGPMR